MNQICYHCGGELVSRGGRLVCEHCGQYMPEKITSEEISLLYTAFQKLRLADFYEAEREFDDIIRRHPKNAQAYWGRLMAHHGIKFEHDNGRYVPTCYEASMESVLESSDYRKALEYADEQNRSFFKEKADYMEQIRREWLKKTSAEKPYDIFISFKDSDENDKTREHTVDSEELKDLYVYLRDRGYKVFFSRYTLEKSKKYEPQIYHALSTAKIMIVYGSKVDYINSEWVKNEWTRYQKRIALGEKHPDSLIVAYKGFSPYDLPRELSESSRQGVDASKPSFYADLLETIERIIGELPKSAKQTKKGGSQTATQSPKAKPNITPLHEHTYRTKVVKSTCVERGYTLHQCTICGEEHRDDYMPLAEHRFKVTGKTEPTCTTQGKEEQTCEVCGDKKITPIPALGHQFSKWTEAKHATCMTDGKEQRQCQRCGEIEENVLPQTGHLFGEWTKQSDGTYTRYCKNCGETQKNKLLPEEVQRKKEKSRKRRKRNFVLSIVLLIVLLIFGFSFYETILIPSAKEKYPFQFAELKYGTYVVSGVHGVKSNLEGSLEIPETICGKRIVAIGKTAFSECSGLTSIVIPDSVTSIGAGAFYRCSGLTSVTIGNGVTSIEYKAFEDCTGLTSIVIPDSVTSIGSEAFEGCTGLTSIVIPDNVTSIGSEAFRDCTGLTSIVIPDSVTSIGESAFEGCTGLTSIAIPNGVTSIDHAAFNACTGLTSIVIPDGVTSIDQTAFRNCTGLTSVVIPDSVTNIGNYAFYDCTKLETIRFSGTMDQWNAISKKYWINNSVLASEVICSDGTIPFR